MGTVYRSFFTATATLFLCLTAAQLQTSESVIIFEFSQVFFENRGGRDYLGCCSGRLGADCPPCLPVYLRICIQHYQASIDPNANCTFLEIDTPLLRPYANSTTEASEGLQALYDNRNMTYPFDYGWPGPFSLVVEAWHPRESSAGSKILVARFKAQRTLKLGYDWTHDELSTNQSSLRIMYRVFCPSNYYGRNCGILCKPRDDKFGHYTCREDGQKLCKQGWTDDYCDKPLCPGCQNGKCLMPNICHCNPGWEGELCDKCIRYPGCIHGTCHVPFECECDEGWGGLFCDLDLNYCTNHKPCQNGGTCTNTGQGSYTCSCTDEYMGKNCNLLQNPCEMDPCKNNGTCKNSNPGNYTCECAPGFFGPHCETTASICTRNPCENGGSCLHHPSGFICKCLPGFSGDLCKKPEMLTCKSSYCLNGGTCVELSSGLHCRCPPGLSGDHCETLVTCSLNTCKNGGVCHQYPSTGHYSCSCPLKFTGLYCEVELQTCDSNPCANRGQCYNLSDGYRCDCKPGFSGKNCSIEYCSSSPCLNGAFCQDRENGFVCQCLNGYSGVRCQHKSNSSLDLNRQSSLASNISHQISSPTEESQSLSGKQVALIASLSSILPVFVIVLCCVLCCILRRRKQQQRADDTMKAKECDFDVEDEQMQNERNSMQMNNKQCNMPQKIVNTLDRLPAKVSNEAPPKVLNIEVSNKKVLDKSLVCTQRTLQKKDNTYGSSISHISQDWPSSNVGIYVIEDHFRSCPEVGTTLEIENILATEV